MNDVTQINPVMIPCRKCKALPGRDCEREWDRRDDRQDGFHRCRVNDAVRVSALIEW